MITKFDGLPNERLIGALGKARNLARTLDRRTAPAGR